MYYVLQLALALTQYTFFHWGAFTNEATVKCALASECDNYRVPPMKFEALATNWTNSADLLSAQITGYFLNSNETETIRKLARTEVARQGALREMQGFVLSAEEAEAVKEAAQIDVWNAVREELVEHLNGKLKEFEAWCDLMRAKGQYYSQDMGSVCDWKHPNHA